MSANRDPSLQWIYLLWKMFKVANSSEFSKRMRYFCQSELAGCLTNLFMRCLPEILFWETDLFVQRLFAKNVYFFSSSLVLPEPRSQIRHLTSLLILVLVSLIFLFYIFSSFLNKEPKSLNTARQSPHQHSPPNFKLSQHSPDHHVSGTLPTLIWNANIWTVQKMGLMSFLVHIPALLLNLFGCLVDVRGKWVTTGLVDLHLHIGIMSVPGLNSGYQVSGATGAIFTWRLIWSKGAEDGNSYKPPTLPWLKSIDGLNMHDMSYESAMAGGTTTMQVLLGSTNNLGKYMLFSSLIQFWHLWRWPIVPHQTLAH